MIQSFNGSYAPTAPPRWRPRTSATLQQPSSQVAYSQHQPVRSKVVFPLRPSVKLQPQCSKKGKPGGRTCRFCVADHPQRPCVGELYPTERATATKRVGWRCLTYSLTRMPPVRESPGRQPVVSLTPWVLPSTERPCPCPSSSTRFCIQVQCRSFGFSATTVPVVLRGGHPEPGQRTSTARAS